PMWRKNATGYAGLLADADGVVVETLAEPGQVVRATSARPQAQANVAQKRHRLCRTAGGC
ncbi:hypothetical protein EVV80_28690, partial [Klebsiella pneumoniae]